MNLNMEVIRDLLMPLVRTVEMEILTPVFPDAYAQLLVVEGELCLSVETSSDPLIVTVYKLLTQEEILDNSYKRTLRPKLEEKFNLLVAWKNEETVQ